ncbi:glycosyltransferase family 9 protein [Nitrospira lenta]|uniref:Putative ADP-heptose-LPS heptosyltransferase n=1 Tax=Nitrospira lenta TaxID=1436998 RepID=A0A330L9W1_9BACT|nr:glycosyltransferase family 9 protein [Nitrospira lenta]SPP65644.1 putative ADP-heptose-LPS heptosyltransferase [Nitrospira lenta]
MNVLIVRPDGIGDLVLSLPVATQLRQLIPGVRIGVLANPVAAPILEHHPDIDYVRTVSLQAAIPDMMQAFSGGIDAVIFLKPFRRLMWAAWRAGVPLRVATGFRWQSVLSNRWVYEHRSSFQKHESDYNVEMLKGLRLTPLSVVAPVLRLTDAERAGGERHWSGTVMPRVVIHPGGVSARHWRPVHYRDLAQMLAQQGYAVVLTGSPVERDQFQREALDGAVLHPGISNLMGQLTVRELMAVIGAAHVVVSGATGPAHLAAALSVPTVSLFDPRRNNLPTRWKPLGRGVLLRPDVPTCEKCIGEACPYWDCLDRFTVADVAARLGAVVRSVQPLTIHHV